jgi:2,5-dioxopentanoate dehydrogenase
MSLSPSLHGFSLVAGDRGAPGGRTFRAVNPAGGPPLAPDFHEAAPAEADRALELARAAQAPFAETAGETRATLLEAIAAGIEELGDALIARAAAETGLPAARLTGERARTCGQLRLFAQVVREGSWVDARLDPALPERRPLPRPDVRRLLRPVGPVVVFGSSNFPLAFSTAGGDTASALAAGCPVVVKAHRAHPGTAELVAGAVTRAVAAVGLPPGVFSQLHGEGATLGMRLVRHPATAAVGFTGSQAAGRALHDAAASRPRPIPVFAEMSSLNPVFLLPGALRERGAEIAAGLLASFTLGVGQFCTKPGLVFAVRGEATEAFLTALGTAVRAAPCGTMLTPGIRAAFLANQERLLATAGVAPWAGGSGEPAAERHEARPVVARTTAANFLAHPELAEEAFGPFTLVVEAPDLAALAACAAALSGQLTATLHGTPEDLAAAGALRPLLEERAGRLVLNGFPTGVEVCPAMHHGGPYPATTDSRFTSVGTAAILRFARPVCYQGFPDALLPPALQDANPLGLLRLVDGRPTREPLAARRAG